MKITSNYRVHELKSLSDLPESERSDFDYVDDNTERRFFRAYGSWYDVNEFESVHSFTGIKEGYLKWDGVQTQSYFDAILVRYPNDGYGPDTEYVIVGHATW